ncbi:MAG: hypothetical protein JJ863_15230 [Deltaproteobacteria bacterium]|nr:hypothetical protein [Deltaproteobacteria bacterium]
MVGLALAMAFCAVGSGHAHAQAERLTILPQAGLESLAMELARSLERRMGLDVSVGEAPPLLPEAVRTDELALVREEEGGVTLAMGRKGGGAVTRTMAIDGESADAFPVSLAVEALRDEATIPAPPLDSPPSENAYVYYEYERPPVVREMRATPTLYMKILAGYSPVQDQWLVGPGAGLGLCISGHCLVIEADLPLVPDEVVWQDRKLYYRAVSTSLRLQIRPVIREQWSFGITLGALSRMGNVTWDREGADDERQRATNFGARLSTELAIRIAGPFELVVEAGIDMLKDRATFRDGVDFTYVEDRYTPWATLSFRMRPFQR